MKIWINVSYGTQFGHFHKLRKKEKRKEWKIEIETVISIGANRNREICTLNDQFKAIWEYLDSNYRYIFFISVSGMSSWDLLIWSLLLWTGAFGDMGTGPRQVVAATLTLSQPGDPILMSPGPPDEYRLFMSFVFLTDAVKTEKKNLWSPDDMPETRS